MRRRRPERGLEEEIRALLPFAAGECVVVACSGGSDSIALAALAGREAERSRARVLLAHVDHGIRREAARDEAVVLSAALALGLRVVTARLAAGSRAEERLRDARYLALRAIAARAGAARVVTAHHAGDQSESVLLALLRGASPDGARGIAPARPLGDGVRLERPLLGVDPARLRAYVLRRHLPYAVDATNDDAGYRRVAVRRALADLRAPFPGLDEALARFAAFARAERAAGPEAEHARLRRDLREEVERLTGDARDLTFRRLDAAARAVATERRGRYGLRRGVDVVVRGAEA